MNEFKDLTICPDCRLRQELDKKEGDECDNLNCESYIERVGKTLKWMNPNWG